MKTLAKWIIIASFAVNFLGCTGQSEPTISQRMSQLEPGLSREKVEEVFGKPTDCSAADTMLTCRYESNVRVHSSETDSLIAWKSNAGPDPYGAGFFLIAFPVAVVLDASGALDETKKHAFYLTYDEDGILREIAD